MIEVKKFHINVVLTITTGKFLCEMKEVYEILNHLTGQKLMTHQLLRAFDAAKEFLLLTFPGLSKITIPDDLEGNEAACMRFCTIAAEKYGTWYSVPRMPEGEFYKVMHPLEEPLLFGTNVIFVSMEDEDEDEK